MNTFYSAILVFNNTLEKINTSENRVLIFFTSDCYQYYKQYCEQWKRISNNIFSRLAGLYGLINNRTEIGELLHNMIDTQYVDTLGDVGDMFPPSFFFSLFYFVSIVSVHRVDHLQLHPVLDYHVILTRSVLKLVPNEQISHLLVLLHFFGEDVC